MAESPLYFVDLHHDLDDCELGARQKPGEQPLPKLRIAAAIADEVSHGGFADYGPDHDSTMAFLDIPGQGNLPLLTHLGKCAFSENVFNRRMIARGLIDILRDFSNNEEDFLAVMEIVVRLSEDAAEPTVWTELMEQIPPIAVFLQENRSDFPVVLSEYLTPIVLRYLADPNSQVRKSSQEVLLILLEQDLISQHDVENKIICKVALVLSKNTAQRLLLPRICDLCGARKLFQVPKVCAANFGDICHAVGQEATEKFLRLLRGRSAEPSCPLFIRLISDPCRQVHQAAFQSLGPFISTFASPPRAGFYIGEDGTLSI